MMTGYIDPDRAQFDAFKGLDRDTPLNMVNLVKLRDKAAYPDDHALAAKALTGAQAYKNYGAESGPVLADVGGSILWRGQFEATLSAFPDADAAEHVVLVVPVEAMTADPDRAEAYVEAVVTMLVSLTED